MNGLAFLDQGRVLVTLSGPVIGGPLTLASNLSFVVLLVLRPEWTWSLLATTGVVLGLGLAALVIGLAIGQRTVRGSLWPPSFMARCLHVLALQVLMGGVLTYRSARKAFSGKHLEFVRTPKQGGLRSREPDKVV